MTRYGVIIGQARPSFYEFNIADPAVRPVNYEYVQIELEEQASGGVRRVQVLGQVKSLFSRHPFYDQRITPSAVWKQHELGVGDELMQIIASVKILGYIHEEHGRCRRGLALQLTAPAHYLPGLDVPDVKRRVPVLERVPQFVCFRGVGAWLGFGDKAPFSCAARTL